MQVTEVAATVVPVFALVAVGYVFGRLRSVELVSLTDIVVYLGGPSLVFYSLVTGTIPPAEVALLVGGTVFTVLGVGVVALGVCRLSGQRPGVLLLPAMFMNAGNMLLPLCLFAFGEPGLRRGVVVFATMTVLQATLGVMIASGRPDLRETFRLPYIHAVVAAAVVGRAGIELPAVVLRPLGLLADLAVPLMILALGIRLSTVRVLDWRKALFVTIARFGGGYAVACLFVYVSGMDGVARSTLLLASVMPSAVVNFVFAEKYGNESADVAAAVLATTAVSVVTTPLLLAFGI